MTIHHRLRSAGGSVDDGWQILMSTAGDKNTSGNSQNFGYAGSSNFRSITASSTGANNRTAPGDGMGLYDAFFTMTGITKIALVDNWNGGGLAPTNWNHYMVYDLISTTTKSIYNIIKDLDSYNLNNANWANNDAPFSSNSVENFTSGYSGLLSSGTYTYKASSSISHTPDKFVIWGINKDSDNDAQVLCSFYGTLGPGNGKSDSWRGNNPSQTFFSYWGNDWYSNTQSHTISVSSQTNPGVNGTRQGFRGSDTNQYLIAF